MKIMVVDDDETSVEMICAILSKYGTCDKYYEGLKAVNAFERSLEENKPYDLVTLDLAMPEMNGIEVLAGMRDLELDYGVDLLDQSNIIMITILNEPIAYNAAQAAECTDYIVKPLNKERLLNRLRILGIIEED
ncbi:MAG: hypothetical protein A2Y40_07290 [Candidatus Margulisbacteria bacterium GWF2_35_9]|nr:MAG: hypothetical protein A2Y40_07290 [Candidatus Margulisbacteria bacterium GWF2_35_9]